MRKEKRKRGIKSLKVVYSKEEPIKPEKEVINSLVGANNISKKQIPGSISFVPSVAGLIMCSEIIKDILSGSI